MMALEGATNTSTPTAFQFVDLPRLYIHTLPTPPTVPYATISLLREEEQPGTYCYRYRPPRCTNKHRPNARLVGTRVGTQHSRHDTTRLGTT